MPCRGDGRLPRATAGTGSPEAQPPAVVCLPPGLRVAHVVLPPLIDVPTHCDLQRFTRVAVATGGPLQSGISGWRSCCGCAPRWATPRSGSVSSNSAQSSVTPTTATFLPQTGRRQQTLRTQYCTIHAYPRPAQTRHGTPSSRRHKKKRTPRGGLSSPLWHSQHHRVRCSPSRHRCFAKEQSAHRPKLQSSSSGLREPGTSSHCASPCV